jgi:hypothetical protein
VSGYLLTRDGERLNEGQGDGTEEYARWKGNGEEEQKTDRPQTGGHIRLEMSAALASLGVR